MVFDNIKNAQLYYGLGERFRTALEWMATADVSGLSNRDQVVIDGDNVYAKYFDMETKSPEGAMPEGHSNYADIQYLLDGEEAVGYALKGSEPPAKPYNPEKDIAFWDVPYSTIRLKAGDFYIVWPDDLHAPRLALGEPGKVRLLVVKVKLN
ncbi:YhcH/YjgK/YiaL family protein [Pseudoflavonifractor phocaeensis]|uniref:YhcH/YjgK/YiaL family protein n=1 Tax=Pseudoflavonifractor phocaeensis TaxID=1870988 RepID=UPI00195F09B9|nr:YhcH/YjgK/YiaL family protein [Pseudoflavonifractor phocaeensis]MBM6936987.1 YhcH/YjgK/YiaL family protein [Pseudoflavonifractor phocaeensis]